MNRNSTKDITLGQLALVFVPSVLLLTWALMQPALGGDLDLGRTKLTIWAATILLIPALVLFLIKDLEQWIANLSYLFWTSALLVFLVHAWWGIFVVFGGIEDTFVQQGMLSAGGSFLLLGLWVLDALVLWCLPARLQSRNLQVVVRLLVFAGFAVALAGRRGGSVQLLGLVFIGTLAFAAMISLLARERVLAPKSSGYT